MKKIVFVGLLVGIALAVIGAEPVKVIMATTDDGRRVILMPDGKWNFVEGAPQAAKPEIKSESGDCREKIWPDLLSLFSGWPIEHTEKSSWLVQTGWKEMTPSGMSSPFRVRAQVTIGENCSIDYSIEYQSKNEFGWAHYLICGPDAKLPFGGGKKMCEFDQKLRADLQNLASKYKPASP